MTKHKVFISYHHEEDQFYKECLQKINQQSNIFIDRSVDIGDINEDDDDEEIRIKIRDEYLQDTSVLILLVGNNTKNRKHIDWEIYSAMRDGKINKKSGILVINLPSTLHVCTVMSTHGIDEQNLYPESEGWTHIKDRAEYEKKFPLMPKRIIDSLVDGNARISATSWFDIVGNPDLLRSLIDFTFKDKDLFDYSFQTEMRKRNSN